MFSHYVDMVFLFKSGLGTARLIPNSKQSIRRYISGGRWRQNYLCMHLHRYTTNQRNEDALTGWMLADKTSTCIGCIGASRPTWATRLRLARMAFVLQTISWMYSTPDPCVKWNLYVGPVYKDKLGVYYLGYVEEHTSVSGPLCAHMHNIL